MPKECVKNRKFFIIIVIKEQGNMLSTQDKFMTLVYLLFASLTRSGLKVMVPQIFITAIYLKDVHIFLHRAVLMIFASKLQVA